jgi:hypothetical protein
MKDAHKGGKKHGAKAGAAAVRAGSSKHLTVSRLGFKVKKQHKSKMQLKNKLIEMQESQLAELRAMVASMKRTKARARVGRRVARVCGVRAYPHVNVCLRLDPNVRRRRCPSWTKRRK